MALRVGWRCVCGREFWPAYNKTGRQRLSAHVRHYHDYSGKRYKLVMEKAEKLVKEAE